LSVSPTGKQTVVNGVDLFRMQDGRQAKHWGVPDMFSFLVQLASCATGYAGTRHAHLAPSPATTGRKLLSAVLTC
jgi:hypothetical protein